MTEKTKTSDEVKNTEVTDAQEVKATETKKPAKKKKKSSTKKGMKKVKALAGNLAGKYLLSYSKGQTFEIEEKQAAEMIEAGDVKEV